MEFVRECFNIPKTPNDFMALLDNRQSTEFIKDVSVSLLNLSSSPEFISAKIFFDYLATIHNSHREIFIELLSQEKCESGLGFIRLLNHMGSSFFSIFSLDKDTEENTSRCIINVLRFISHAPKNEGIKAITNICEDHKSAALFAMARQSFDSEIRNLRNSLNSIYNFTNFVPFKLSLFEHAVFCDVLDKALVLQQYHLIPLIIPNILYIADTGDGVFRFLSDSSIYRIYINLICQYLQNQTFVGAFLIIELIPKLRGGIDNFLTNVNEYVATSDEVINIDIDVIRNTLFINNFDLSLNDMSPVEVIRTIFQKPLLITSFYDYLLDIISLSKIHIFIKIIPELLINVDDFIAFLSSKDQFVEFLMRISQICEIIEQNDIFETVWYFLLYCIQIYWSSGSPFFRKNINSFLEKVSPNMNYFIVSLLTKAQPAAEVKIPMPNTPFLKSVRLLSELFDKCSIQQISKIAKRAEESSYVWPSILIPCICTPKKEHKIIASFKLANHPIVNSLFECLLNHMDIRPINLVSPLIRSPDFDLLIRSKPEKVGDLSRILREHINCLNSDMSITQKKFQEIACCWRAWASVFGLQSLQTTIFNVIATIIACFKAPTDSVQLFEIVGYVLSTICDRNESDLEKMVEKTLAYVTESPNMSYMAALGLSKFCVIMICLVRENWNNLFVKVLNFAIDKIKTDNEGKTIQSTFAIEFIKTSLFTPSLQNHIVDKDSFFQYLIDFRDWSTVIDYFIIKANIKLSNLTSDFSEDEFDFI